MPHFLNTWTGEFEWHADPRKIVYAILSHTWRSPDEGGEQSYSDVRRLQMSVNAEPEQRQRRLYAATVDIIRCHQITTPSQAKRVSPHFLLPKGAAALPSFVLYHPELSHKIKYACKVARKDGYLLLWIDTCCIDKSSSAELSEAINSMFEWYRLADVCYAYLEDVPDDDDPTQSTSYFWQSRWHTRGWTLQELIAPKRVVFLTRTWGCLGTKAGLASSLEKITGVDFNILTGHVLLHSVSVARRMSWAAFRETTRIEDRAYSLLGIFDIHMSPIYGEGQNAFLRLQEEIVRTIPDHSIFAWGSSCTLPSLTEGGGVVAKQRTDNGGIGLLAGSPSAFQGLADIAPLSSIEFATRLGLRPEDVPTLDCIFASQGVRVKLPCIDLGKTPQLFKALHLAREPESSPSTLPESTEVCPDCIQIQLACDVLAFLQCEDKSGSLIALPVCALQELLRGTPTPRSDLELYVYFGSRCRSFGPRHDGPITAPGHCAFRKPLNLSFRVVRLSILALSETLKQNSRTPLRISELTILRHKRRPENSKSSRSVEYLDREPIKEKIQYWPDDREDEPVFSLAPRTIDELGALGFYVAPLRCERRSAKIRLKTTLAPRPHPQHPDSQQPPKLEPTMGLLFNLELTTDHLGRFGSGDARVSENLLVPSAEVGACNLGLPLPFGYVGDMLVDEAEFYLHPTGICYCGDLSDGRIVVENYSVVHAEYDLEKPKQDWPFRHLRLALERPAWSSTIRDCKNVWVIIELSDKFTDARPEHMIQHYSPVEPKGHWQSEAESRAPAHAPSLLAEDGANTGRHSIVTSDRGDPDAREGDHPSSTSREDDPKPVDEAGAACACLHSVEALRRENESLRAALSLQTDRVSTLASQVAAMMSQLEALTAAQNRTSGKS